MSDQTPEQIAKTLVGHLVEANFISASNNLSDAAFEREQERLECDAYALILPVIREARSDGARVEQFSYLNPRTPEKYLCAKCGASGVKLWRQYNTFLDYLKLMCVDCALKDCKESFEVEADGYHNGYGHRSCQIGMGALIPAIPTEENDTFWGYTSVPEAGVLWWKNLPLRRAIRERGNQADEKVGE